MSEGNALAVDVGEAVDERSKSETETSAVRRYCERNHDGART
jgi:hypothetical protein